MDAGLLAALGEPNRLRIVELLNLAPRPVGEIASTLGVRQPQVTKHLQTLQRAGLVTVHPLGQRRIYALRRERLRELRGWLDAFEPSHPSEAVLDQYERAIAEEQALAARDPGWATGRRIRLRRTLRAPADAVWARWTSARHIRRWWSPEHFIVAECRANAVPGGTLRIVLEEGDGTRHVARGRYLALARPHALSFELSPLGPDGSPLFAAVHHVRLSELPDRTILTLTIRVASVSPQAAPALAGLRPGWAQLLDKLAAVLSASSECVRP
jgi:uncharacterized protein YndB with AHSA1/START domain/DNA-binding transcriptional ArsR family regulator